MPSSKTVTTPQMVRMIKRGENGSSSVSMGLLELILRYYSFEPQFNPACKSPVHDIGSGGHGHDSRSGQGYRINRDAINHEPSRRSVLLQCSAIGRPLNGSV